MGFLGVVVCRLGYKSWVFRFKGGDSGVYGFFVLELRKEGVL